MKKNQLFTLELLKEQLAYDTETGLFIRKVDSRRAKAGEIANKTRKLDLVDFIHVLGCEIRAERLVWFYHHNKFPCGDLNYRDGDRRNYKIENLIDSGVSVKAEACRRKHAPLNGCRGKYAAR